MDQLSKRMAALSPEQRAMLEEQLKSKGLGHLARHAAAASSAAVAQRSQGEAPVAAPAQPPLRRDMKFGLYSFSGDGSTQSDQKYRLLLESAKYADEHGFAAIWTPERHFQDFGGLYPNPAVISAALAVTTKRIEIRAGSVAVPLHHPVRICEEWAVVDNLSGGRAAICCASGWHPADFILAPRRSLHDYENRREVMIESIAEIRQLWSGDAVSFPGIEGEEAEVRVLPRPLRKELPIWIASQGTTETFIRAGEVGAHLLTGIVDQPLPELARKISLYREALERNGHDPQAGVVTVMLHAFLGESNEEVKAKVRQPMISYLQTFLKQQEKISDFDLATESDKQTLLSFAFERYFAEEALFGTVEKCSALIDNLMGIGVNEVACLVDFGLDEEAVLNSLTYLTQLKDLYGQNSSQEVER